MNINEMQVKKRDLEATIQALIDAFIKQTGVTVTGVKPIVEDYHGDIFCRDVEVEVKL